MQRVIADKQVWKPKQFFLQWEWILLVVFIGVNVLNMYLSPYYLDFFNLRDATMAFLDKAFIVLPMVLVMVLADIDISVASTVALSSVVMADLYQKGVPMELAVIICLLVGTACGWINGMLIVKFKELSAVIVTLITMILYRGIAYVILENQAAGNFPDWFSYLGWGYVGDIPFIFIVFVVFAILFGLLLHKTTFGKHVYAIGTNPTASRFSGIPVDRVKVIVFTLTGFMAAVTALFLTSKMGSTRPNIANMYELEVIAMAVLGGVSTAGGKGRMIGAIIAIFLVGLLRYGLGLVNVNAQLQLIIIGGLLIAAVALTQLKRGKKE